MYTRYPLTETECLIRDFALASIRNSLAAYNEEKKQYQDHFLKHKLADKQSALRYYRRLSLLNTKITVMSYALANHCFKPEFSFSSN